MKRLHFAAIDLTYNCNLRCKHCYNKSGTVTNKKELDDDTVYKLVQEIATFQPESFCFCGGEPLLRKEILFKSAKAIKEINELVNVNFVTNSELFEEKDIQAIKNSKVTMVQVSLDGSTEEMHDWMRGKSGVFNHAIKTLELLQQNKIMSAVSFVPHRKNVDGILDTIEICEKLGVKSFRVQPLMIIGRAKEQMVDEILSFDEYKKLIKTINTKRKANYIQNGMSIEWGDPIEHLVNLESNLNYPSFIVGAYGDIILSPYIPISFGNIHRASITEYLENGLLDMWVSDIYKFLSTYMITPKKLDISGKFDLPDICLDTIELDILSKDFKQNERELIERLSGKLNEKS